MNDKRNILNTERLTFASIPEPNCCLVTAIPVLMLGSFGYVCKPFVAWNFPLWTFLRHNSGYATTPCCWELPGTYYNVVPLPQLPGRWEFPGVLHQPSVNLMPSSPSERVITYERNELLRLRHSKAVIFSTELRKKLNVCRLLRRFRGNRGGRRCRMMWNPDMEVNMEIPIVTCKRGGRCVFRKQMQIQSGVKSASDVRCTPRILRSSDLSSMNSYNRERVLINVPVEDSRLPVLLLTNICHISNKLDDFSVVINRLKPTVVCLTETWLDSTIPHTAIDVYGYRVFRKDRLTGCGGGVDVYVLNEV